MDVRAVILVGGASPDHLEQLAGVPLPLLDVLGVSIVQRVIERLDRFGVSGLAVVTNTPGSAGRVARGSIRPGINWTDAVDGNFWRSAENAFNELAQAGAEIVLVLRLGPYAEIDYEDLVQFHLDKRARLTSVHDGDGASLGSFVISASRRNDAAYLFRHEFQQMRAGCEVYRFSGYLNALRNARDLRTLALDAFAGVAELPPRGREIKPGVWIAENARVHRSARLLAPCFVGSYAKVRASSLLTRASVVEHHAQIDCGTVIENSTILPNTAVGAGLDLVHSVVGFRRIWNLRRAVEVEMNDHRLLGGVRRAPVRMIGSAVQLATAFPEYIGKAFFQRKARPRPELPEAVRRPAASLKKTVPAPEEGLATSEFLPARRYGNE